MQSATLTLAEEACLADVGEPHLLLAAGHVFDREVVAVQLLACEAQA